MQPSSSGLLICHGQVFLTTIPVFVCAHERERELERERERVRKRACERGRQRKKEKPHIK